MTGVCVARECGMIPFCHRVVVAEATPTSLVSFRVLGEGQPPKSPAAESGDSHVTIHSSLQSDWSIAGHMTNSEEDGTTPLISCAADLRPPYHMALDGKTFSVLRESQSLDYQRVRDQLTVM